MNSLTFKKIKLPSANMGDENCLPDMMNDTYIHAPIRVSDNVSPKEKENIGKGMIDTLIPYKVQDGYDRARDIKEFDAAVLENEYLVATFVPALGGRLWSLYDKKADKELLYANDVFQPCNLALRNAWFSGGVEFNIGIKGHNPLTCSPMFAQRETDENGEPMLKMYEYERIRGVAYSITAKLDDEILLLHVNIENTEDKDKYMYWWSNIAVEETPTTRVITPATDSFYCFYDEGAYLLDNMTLPYLGKADVTYSTNLERSRDFFYKIPAESDKWIAALNENGYGLLHMSTKELIGRKLFAWGQGNGGKHWNRWLSDCGKSYIEIQAGLLRTQLEHFIMKANSEISFTEGYTALSADPAKVHGKLCEAQEEIKKTTDKLVPRVEAASFGAKSVDSPEYTGSGWGALENIASGRSVSRNNDFTRESIGAEQAAWLELIEKGSFPEPDPDEQIASYVAGRKWIDMLEESSSENWYKYYQLGVLYYVENELERSGECFKKSIALRENAWSYRCLAQLEKIKGDLGAALVLMENAVSVKNDYQPLIVNCAEMMMATESYEKWLELYDSLSETLRENGRLKIYRALALNKLGRTDETLKIVDRSFVMPDIKEGEFSLSHLWIEMYRNVMKRDGAEAEPTDEEVLAAYPIPEELDFRMH